MKRTTITGVTNESFVHPDGIKEELAAKRHAAELEILAEKDGFEHCDCPACGSARRDFAFDRKGFSFQSCLDCATLFMSPRPTADMLKHYYRQSDYGQFLASDAYLAATESFRFDQARKRADKVIVLREKARDAGTGVLLYAPKTNALASVLTEDGVEGVEQLSAPWDRAPAPQAVGQYGVVSAFDIFERVGDIAAELGRLSALLAPGGRIILSMRSGSGYDLLTLWQHADLVPVEHMNLVTVEGVSRLMAEAGFTVSELSTPGQLDVQIVERMRAREGLKLDRFTEYFLSSRDSFAHEQFQQFLQKSLLSSHMLVVGVKE